MVKRVLDCGDEWMHAQSSHNNRPGRTTAETLLLEECIHNNKTTPHRGKNRSSESVCAARAETARCSKVMS
jgi:hypothetical protein